MNPTIDVHVHTAISDGDMSPLDVLSYARECGLHMLSVTDHDSLSAYTNEFCMMADKFDIRLIIGTELSTVDEADHRYHILAYGSRLRDGCLEKRLREIREERIVSAKAMCACLRTYGWFTDETVFNDSETITKTHVAMAVLKEKRNEEKLLRAWGGTIPLPGAFIEKWIIPGKPCYIPVHHGLHPGEAIDLIHADGGLAILAHPSEYVLKGEMLDDVILKMVDYGIDGIEAISAVFDRTHGDVLIEHKEKLFALAEEYRLLITGGSDFHTKPPSVLGHVIDLGFRHHPWVLQEKDMRDFLSAYS